MKKCLTIAGSDNSGGAGLQADLKVFTLLGVFGLSATTAITVQNSKGVKESIPVSSSVLSDQINSLIEDTKIDAVKIGMLQTRKNVEALIRILTEKNLKNVVLDTVIKSSSGKLLLEEKALGAFKHLIKLVDIITPNTQEAQVLTGKQIKSVEDMIDTCRLLLEQGVKAVHLKGGHMPFKEKIVDVYMDEDRYEVIEYPKLNVDRNIHGTGCVLSSAIAVYIAKGYEKLDAVKKARQFLQSQIENSFLFGKGYLYMPLTQL